MSERTTGHFSRRTVFRAGAGAVLGCGVGAVLPAVLPAGPAATAAPLVRAAVAPAAQPFPLTAVSLLSGRLQQNMGRTVAYLRYLDPDRLLHMFRVTAKLSSSAQPCGGWESPDTELRGHSMGHVLSGLAQGYANTGDSALKSTGDTLVAGLAACQAGARAAGFNQGYLSAYPESFIDRVETGQQVWAPYYTLHKIMAGLLDQYQLAGNTQALTVLKAQASWVKFRNDRLSYQQRQAMLRTEFGGMNDVLTALYQVTGNADHLSTARYFDHAEIFDPLAAGQDRLQGYHANTQIPKAIGAAREYEVTGDTRYRTIATTFWNVVTRDHSYANGDNSNGEYFQAPGKLAAELSDYTCESCNAYNMLKLTRALWRQDPQSSYMDYYENALYNHTLGSQDPRSGYGYNAYYVPLRPGGIKTYSNDYYNFTCCHGTALESNTKYADSIYGYAGNTLYVNLFVPSVLTWPGRGLTVRQETSFPAQAGSTLRVGGSGFIDLRVRIPGWAKGASITLNGAAWTGPVTPGSYAQLSRNWTSGDRVELSLPMALRQEAMPDDSGMRAVKIGPILLAGEYGGNDLGTMPTLDPATLRPTGTALTYTGTASTGPVRLSPFYDVHGQRYNVYWRMPVTVPEKVLYYRFNETGGSIAADSTGNGRTGQLSGSAGWAAGRSGNALALTGGYLSIPSGVLAGATAFTLATWVRPDAASGTWARIVDFSGGSGSGAYLFLTPRSGANTTRYAISRGGAGGEQVLEAAALPTGTWSHVAVTHTGTTAVLYVNGAEVARNTSMTLRPADLGSTSQNSIGRSAYAGDPNLLGLLDEFHLRGRALSAAEIASLYREV